jgi:GT2 family glycosyltransferase
VTEPEAVWVVVLNYKAPQLTLDCVASLRALRRPCRIIVVDNGSEDGSVERFREAAGTDVVVLASPENRGYGAGNNLGILHALEHGAEAVWILNNDTVVEPETLEAMLPTLDSAGGGVVLPLIQLAGEPPVVWYRGGEVDERRMDVQHWDVGRPVADLPAEGPEREITFATGCSLLVPRSTFEQIGLLEERFFLYWEDYEFSNRLRHAGLPIRMATGAVVTHDAGGSSRLGVGPSPTYLYYNTRNRIWLMRESGASVARHAYRAASVLRWEMRDILGSSHRPRRAFALVRGLLDGYRLRPTASSIPRVA